MAHKIPYDKGITLSRDIYMVKSEPGVYYDSQGGVVDPKLAKAAGFDVDTHLRQKKVTERTASARAKIEREVKLEELRAQFEDAPPFLAEHKGGGFWGVVHRDTPTVFVWTSSEREGAKPSAQAQAHELNEALYKRMAGFEADDSLSEPFAADPAEALHGGGDPPDGGGGDSAE
jgi:hypothetical protein